MNAAITENAVCPDCRVKLNIRGECVGCLLRVGLAASSDPAFSMDVPAVFGDFQIVCHEDGSHWELGRGAMGATYRAMDNVLKRVVALKVVAAPDGLARSPVIRERFLREARGAAGLHHPNVAEVFHFGTAPQTDHAYYAMEMIEGETLEERVRRDGPMRVDDALEIAMQVASALVAAADRGLIHRDLKPSNIMLAGKGSPGMLRVKVIDFGLAKAVVGVENETRLTHGGFVGTPAFASPEQFRGEPADARADIYSLGATLWYTLTGKVPFPGKTIEEIHRCQVAGVLPMWQLAARNVPAAIVALLRRALATDTGARIQSARELLTELERCRQRRFGWLVLATAFVVICTLLGIDWRAHPVAMMDKSANEQPVADQKAYALYARAKAIHVYDDPEGAERSMHEKVSLLEEATRRDPKFALAYCELARAEAAFGEDARLTAARKATETAFNLGVAQRDYHLTSAFVALRTGDLDHARREAAIALSTSPNDAEALQIMSNADTAQEHWREGLAEMEQAYELDPGNYEIEWQLGLIYQSMRRYKDRERLLANSRTASRVTIYWRYIASVALKLDEGDPTGAREILKQIPSDYSPINGIWGERFATALFLRDYDEAERVIAATPAKWQAEMYGGSPPLSWQNGMLAHLRGDEQKARAIFAALRQGIGTASGGDVDPDIAPLCDALLGRKDDAIREARDECAKHPLADLHTHPGPVKDSIRNLARVYALTGERDQAIEQLAILAGLYNTISYGDVRCGPCWDKLRGNPRFETIVASLAPE